MKRSDLQNFDIVETRHGKMYMVDIDKEVIFEIYEWKFLEDYKDDLTYEGVHSQPRDYDIVRVRRPNEGYQNLTCYWYKAPVIWERKEKPELSHDEKIILRALNKPEWWIARDSYGLYLYEKKPVYERVWWGSSGVNMTLYEHLFSFVEKDKDCYQVKDLIDGKE